MKKCRCDKMQMIDLEFYNIILEDYDKKIENKEIYECTCLQCGKTSYLSDNELESRYVINITYFNYPKSILQLEYNIFLKEFEKIGVNPSTYEIYFAINSIVTLLSKKEKDDMIKKYKFSDVRYHIVKLIVEKYKDKKLNSVLRFNKELLLNLKNENYDFNLEELSDKEITFENLVEYGPYILSN